MNLIDKIFETSKSKKRVAIMPYYMMGYPHKDLSLTILETLSKKGADLIEVGIPYSDPVADGPVIQEASLRALNKGVNIDYVMDAISKLRKKHPDTGIVFMTYYNIILQYGLEAFAEICERSGVSGAIAADLPLEESAALKSALKKRGIYLIHLIPPNLSLERIVAITKQAEGFIYLVAVTGVTGARSELPNYLPEFVAKIRSVTDVPLALGFGISNTDQVRQASQHVDGIIVGSALIKQLADTQNAVDKASTFMSKLANYDQ